MQNSGQVSQETGGGIRYRVSVRYLGRYGNGFRQTPSLLSPSTPAQLPETDPDRKVFPHQTAQQATAESTVPFPSPQYKELDRFAPVEAGPPSGFRLGRPQSFPGRARRTPRTQ